MLTDHGSITDVPGIWVGHHQRSSRGWRTGATVVFAPEGAVAGVDVRGGGPGTRETDALVPWNLVDRINAVCLTGGSAYGLAAADGVMDYLAEQDLGFRVGPDKGEVVPVVPTAVIFDLGRGGSFASRPDAGFGYRAAAAASAKERRRGSVGAGMGAVAGGLRGGIGMASSKVVFTVDGTHDVAVTVGALCVVNARGSLIDATTGLPHHRTQACDGPRPMIAEPFRPISTASMRLRSTQPWRSWLLTPASTEPNQLESPWPDTTGCLERSNPSTPWPTVTPCSRSPPAVSNWMMPSESPN